jgi:hypothetical protein
MGGSHSHSSPQRPRPQPPRYSYTYYDIDIPSNANDQINNNNNVLAYNKNVQIPTLTSSINTKTQDITNDTNIKNNLDKQITTNIHLQEQINKQISTLTDDRANTDDLIEKTEGFTEGLDGGDSPLVSSILSAVTDIQNYYSSVQTQNNLLITTMSEYTSNIVTNDRKSNVKESTSDFYILLNSYLFKSYYIFLIILLYLYLYVQQKKEFYSKLFIIIAFAIFPFISIYIMHFLYYIYRVCYSFIFAVPYVPLKQ